MYLAFDHLGLKDRKVWPCHMCSGGCTEWDWFSKPREKLQPIFPKQPMLLYAFTLANPDECISTITRQCFNFFLFKCKHKTLTDRSLYCDYHSAVPSLFPALIIRFLHYRTQRGYFTWRLDAEELQMLIQGVYSKSGVNLTKAVFDVPDWAANVCGVATFTRGLAPFTPGLESSLTIRRLNNSRSWEICPSRLVWPSV